MQIKVRALRGGGRPLIRVAPDPAVVQATVLVFVAVAGAHQEIAHRRLCRDFGAPAFQVIVEPVQMKRGVEVGDSRRGSELHVTGVVGGVSMMGPRADEQPHGRLFSCLERAKILYRSTPIYVT